MKEISFGTDGWRGIIGDNYTFRNVRKVSQAVADYVGSGSRVAVGFDTRFQSGRFARIAAEVLAANGVDVLLCDRSIPTPALSFTVKKRELDLGVMITASHNPAAYNGFKIKTASGGAAGPEVTSRVEQLLDKHPVKTDACGDAIKVEDFSRAYVRFLRRYIDLKRIKKKRFKVIVDAMYGAGNSFMADILKGTDIRVEFMRHEINPSFGGIHPEPVEELLPGLKRRVKQGKFDLGIALDGDADRVAAVAPGGVFVHPQKILGLLALHLHEDRKWSGGIVKTVAGTTMMDHIASYLGVRLYETPVGFKYISNLMETKDIVAGGEEAGGMGVTNYIPERDGTLAGLLLLEMMVYRNKDILKILRDVEKRFGKYYYLRDALRLKSRPRLKREDFPGKLLGVEVVEVKDSDGIKMICRDESWLMLRASGTEPIVRLYAESRSLKKSRALIELGKSFLSAQ
ncbi:MAG: phosphoglucomutase/phosphomannomutase family protein [Candidatus Omnitrophica bacterium]|nr:phosphoglucomutase/phosphomannomutase family protein [Candidatus Omnitrophota bacterium]